MISSSLPAAAWAVRFSQYLSRNFSLPPFSFSFSFFRSPLAPKPKGKVADPPGVNSSSESPPLPSSPSSPMGAKGNMPDMPFSPASSMKLFLRSSMASRSSSRMPNCFIRSSTGLMPSARAQVRQ